MNIKYIFILFLALTISCSQKKSGGIVKDVASKPINLAEEAIKLSQDYIIVDGHVDLPYRLKNKWEDVSVQTEGGHFDYVRANTRQLARCSR